jgi:chitinase
VSPANGRRLSKIRITVVVLVVATAVAGGWMFLRAKEYEANAAVVTSSFAPYVDITATPQYAFEGTAGSAPTSAVLSFVVSSPDAACEPSWGGAYPLAAAADGLDLDRRVARLRQLGGEVTISFGGAANSELSIGCTDQAQLTSAYQSIVDRYSVTSIDLDIEGPAASDPAVSKRRAEAIAALATAQAAAGEPLQIWLTLPVGAAGLTDEGQAVLSAMLTAKVEVTGVNGMTMDYGVPLPAGTTMADQGELALTALQEQIKSAFAAAGTPLSDGQAWQRTGATPMIGQNDISGEVFGLDDAHQLVAFAELHQLARVSMWSANRDQDCGPNYPNLTVVSDACSGVAQLPGEFAAILSEVASGQAPAATSTPSPTTQQPTTAPSMVDDPATSPYPIWNVNQSYPKGTETVWRRNVYQAKWYTTGDQPDLPVATADLTPWTLIGPVLPGETPAATPTLAAGTYPEWTATDVYVAGSRVLMDGVGYQAKYWTQGDTPGAPPTKPGETSPWVPLTAG